MTRILLAAFFAAFATAAQAQSFATVKPGKDFWWQRTSFTPMHTEVRGIPVQKIRPDWCKATEFTRELMPKKEMEEEGSDKIMDEVGLAFAVEGRFVRNRRGARQVALVGVYQTCAGKKGRFLLVLDQGSNNIRFVDVTPTETQFAVLAPDKRAVVILYCLECDVGDTLRWNTNKKAFAWVKSRGH